MNPASGWISGIQTAAIMLKRRRGLGGLVDPADFILRVGYELFFFVSLRLSEGANGRKLINTALQVQLYTIRRKELYQYILIPE